MPASLAGATIVTPDLDHSIAAYRDWLGYVAASPGQVGDTLAAAWGTPAAAAARMATLRPESGEARFLRLVEGTPDPDYRPMGSFGWAAAEIVVADVEALARRLGAPGSPFRIIGVPAVLDFDFTDKIKAMQVVGPGGEVLYLTEIGDVIPGFDLPPACSFVGQLFIMVLGAPTIAAGAAAYVAAGRELGPELQARIEVLSAAHDMPLGHRHSLSTIALEGSSYLEIDAFPPSATSRPLSSIGLPSGIAMVTFHSLQATGGHRMQIGGAGEWLEIVDFTKD